MVWSVITQTLSAGSSFCEDHLLHVVIPKNRKSRANFIRFRPVQSKSLLDAEESIPDKSVLRKAFATLRLAGRGIDRQRVLFAAPSSRKEQGRFIKQSKFVTP